MSPRQLRTLRGVSAAAVATLVAATAHTLAGGGAPPPAFVASVIVLAAPLAVLLVGRKLSLPRVTAIVLAAQALFHTAFGVISSVPLPAGGTTGHHHAPAPLALSEPTEATTALLPQAVMLIAHLLAAVVTVLALHRGEHLLRALARGVGRVLQRAAVHPPTEWPRPALPAVAPAHPIALITRFCGVTRRGPPVLVCS